MANRPVKLKLLPRSAMKAKNVTRLVGQVEAGDGMIVTKENGNFTVEVDADGLSIVTGPIPGTDNAVARFNGITGRTLQNSGVLISDADEVSGIPALTLDSSTTPQVTFSPSSGATKTFEIYQQANIGKIASAGIEDKLHIDLSSRGAVASFVPLTISTQNNSSERGITITQTGSTSGSVAGTVSTASGGNPVLAYNQIVIEGEGADVTGATDPKYTYGLNVAMITGGTNSTGGKIAQNVFLYKSAASTPSMARDHIALNVHGVVDAGDGGTGTTSVTANGTMFGAGIVAAARSGATNMFAVCGAEVDVGLNTGSSAHMRLGWSVVGIGDLRAAVYDAAYEIGASATGGSWGNGILFSNFHGAQSVVSTGKLITHDGTANTVASFADFGSWTFTGDILNFPNFQVTGAGAMSVATVNKVAITTPASGATLTIPNGVTLTGPAVSGTAMTLGNTETVTGAKTFSATMTAATVNMSGLGVGVNFGTKGTGINDISGSNTGQFVLSVQNSHGSDGDFGMLIAAGSSGNGADTTTMIRFYNSGLNNILGSVSRNGAGTVAYNLTSDIRGKPNRELLSAEEARRVVDAHCIWDFDKDGNEIRGVGVIAQEAYEINPRFANKPADPDEWWSAEKAAPVPYLVRNLQDANARIDRLEQIIQDLLKAASTKKVL